MHKSTLWLIFVILCVYFSLVLCQDARAGRELVAKETNDLMKNDITALQEDARTRRKHHFHHLYSLWGFYGLAIAYLVKIKVVVVAFLVGSAVYLGLRYYWPHKCAGNEIYKEGSIVLDHPPSFAHHNHIPYSFDHEPYHNAHHYDSGAFTSSGPSSFDPYSAYSSQTFSNSESSYPSSSFTGPGGPPEGLSSDAPSFRRKRSEPKDFNKKTGLVENLARQMVIQEEQIGEFMLNFLGLDSRPCRRRFICEMEFKSKNNPLTSMAFRLIGRNFFAKYTNNQNPFKKANSFEECAAVNADCVFIENNEDAEEDTMAETQQVETITSLEEQNVTNQDSVKETSLENNKIIEKENEHNLEAELRSHVLRKRLRGDRYLKLI